MISRQETAPLGWDGWVRLSIIGFFLGGILGLWTLWICELIAPGHISPNQALLLCILYWPALCLGVGAWRATQGRYALLREPSTQPLPQPLASAPHMVPVLLALWAFGAWTGCYYTSGFFVSSQPMATLFTSLDHAIPLIPKSAFIYVTVQWFVVLAVVLAGDVLPWRQIAAAYTTNIAICTLCFLFFPVTMHHAPIPVTDLSTWVMSVLRSADIANNCFPSSHCSTALLSAFFLYKKKRWWGVLGWISALAIGLTTITTKQHYAADVFAGFALAGISYVLWCRDKAPQPQPHTQRSQP